MRTRLFVPVLVSLVVAGVAGRGMLARDLPPPDLEEGSDADRGIGGAERAFLGVAVESGLSIREVVADSPAERAGLKVGDLLVAVDGEKVTRPFDLVRTVGAKKPGDQLELEVLRGRERLSLVVTLGVRGGTPPVVEPPRDVEGHAFLGVGFGEVPAVLAVHLRLEPGVGVLVGDVRPGSAAEKAGIVTHDVIVKIGGETVKGGRGLVDLIGRARPGDEVTLDIIHRGRPVTKNVTLDERPRGLPTPRLRPDDPRWKIPSPLWPRGPWRGRLGIGDEFYEIPWGDWGLDAWRDGLPRELKERLESGGFDEDLRKHLEEAFKDFDSEPFSRTRSKVRLIEGDLDITVTSEDSRTLVTVTKGGEIIANDLPYAELDTLPESVREKVRTLIEKHKVEIETIEPRRGPPVKLKAEGQRIKV